MFRDYPFTLKTRLLFRPVPFPEDNSLLFRDYPPVPSALSIFWRSSSTQRISFFFFQRLSSYPEDIVYYSAQFFFPEDKFLLFRDYRPILRTLSIILPSFSFQRTSFYYSETILQSLGHYILFFDSSFPQRSGIYNLKTILLSLKHYLLFCDSSSTQRTSIYYS